MKLVINIFGIDIELEGEIDKKEDEKEMVIRVKNIEKAVAKFLKI